MDADEGMKAVGKYQYDNNPVILGYRTEYVLGTELTRAGDFIRIGMGIDPYTLDSLNGQDRILEAGKAIFFFKSDEILKIGNALTQVNASRKALKNTGTIIESTEKINAIYQGVRKEFKK